ncbi:MAG TPA: NAD(P)-dependent oxidoreductase [Patescibacteria group bacterium]
MKSKENIAIIGATGFIGNNLLKFFLKNGHEASSLTLPTRNPHNSSLKNIPQKGTENNTSLNIIQADHLDEKTLRASLERSTYIFDSAALAWQHPGEKKLTPHDLMVEEIVQNAVSAYVLAKVTRPDQIIVWTSTNAIDAMLSRLSPENVGILKKEIETIADMICDAIKIESTHFSEFHNIIVSILSKHQPGIYPKIVGSLDTVQYALDFSYAYSKYLGQTILEKLSQKNIRVLKISDVYGPGQDISKKMIDPKLPARRLQRFMAAYKLIKAGIINWIPTDGKQLHGFTARDGHIVQDVWNDFVFPTHVDDVLTMMMRSTQNNFPKTVLEVSGNKLTNLKMARIVRDAFKVETDIEIQNIKVVNTPETSKDLALLGIDRENLTSLETGIARWLENFEK